MIKAHAVSEPKGKFKTIEYDLGPIAANDIEIKVHSTGLCHSDLSLIDNDWGNASYPMVPGHEVVGHVSALGSNVSRFQIGQVVGLGWHANFCDSCMLCNQGDHNLCLSAQPTIIGRQGGFANRVRASQTAVVSIPKGLSLSHVGPLFCAGITVYNPLVEYNIKPTDRVAVIGIGGLGHLALQFCKAWGCHVTAFTSSEAKVKEAKEMGADGTLNSNDSEALKSARGQFDFIISTVNVNLDWASYLKTLRPRGRLHFVGVIAEPLKLGVVNLLSGQYSISSSPVGSPVTIAQMLEFCLLHDIKPLIETYPFSKVNEAVERLRSGKPHYRIVLEH